MDEYLASRPRKNPGGTPFLDWIRRQRGLESVSAGFVGTDIDLVWYNYKLARLMLLEEKRGTEEYRNSQRTTLSVLDQALSFAFTHPDFTLYTPEQCLAIPPRIRYFGRHVIRFERTSPDDGGIRIDGTPVTKDEFLRFLKFEWTPPVHLADKHARFRSLQSQLEEIVQVLEDQANWEEGDLQA